jgi:hypothetical protein
MCEDRTRTYFINEHLFIKLNVIHKDDMTASVVRVPGYRSRGAGSILGATRFSEK